MYSLNVSFETQTCYNELCANLNDYLLRFNKMILILIHYLILYLTLPWWLSGRVRCLPSRGSKVRIPLVPPRRDVGKVLHLQLPIALRRVNSNTVSML